MDSEKVQSGQVISPRAATWNELIDAKDDYLARRGGLGKRSPRDAELPLDLVKVRNDTGDDLSLGSVVELNGELLDQVQRDYPWFAGATPNGTRTFAILIEPIPDGEIGLAQIAGRVPALVNVTSTGHRFAVVEDGETVLQSADSGPVRLLVAPTATGEALRWVVIGSGAATPMRLAVLTSALSPQGTASAREITYGAGGSQQYVGDPFTVRDFFMNTGDPSLPIDTKFIAKQFAGLWIVTEPYCDPSTTLPGG